jgi:serine protease AprX
VAGIIGAADDQHGGVAPGAVLYNYKVLAGLVTAEDFAGATALQLALEDGAVVANCSWGAGPTGDGTGRMARAVNTAWGLGMVVVKSAGNDGPDPGSITSPADAAGVIVVGATDLEGTTVTEYSSRGPVAGRPGPHVVAPGGTAEAQIVSCHPGGGFAGVGPGTSFAAPHVAGMVALLAEANPDWDTDALRRQIVDAAVLLRAAEPAAQGAGLARL